MIIKVEARTCIVFDLDDTLYNEIDFLVSAYKYISTQIDPASSDQIFYELFTVYKSGGNAFDYIIKKFTNKKYTVDFLLSLYRNHFPKISLKNGVVDLLSNIKKKNGKIGIITNGRSITQRNKIQALGIDKFIDITIVSEEIGFEKPDREVYISFLKNNFLSQFYYIGDNPRIDFITPKKLGWCCIGILDDFNVQKTHIEDFSQEFLPHLFIRNFSELEII